MRGCLVPEKQRLACSSPALDANWEKSLHGKALFHYREYREAIAAGMGMGLPLLGEVEKERIGRVE